ncbi:MAG TPA: GntG family PLP-dependent aldolase, partial [Phycisphaerales bacterium]|nr:GntG family PLP-dependent aldolase [Phycisphaerales bacterium]
MPPPIDLRSDTVTRPTAAMRKAMADAIVGDDVLGDDPTVIELQNRFAQLTGKEAACFVPSGTMANETAIRAQTEPGDEIICEINGHIVDHETGGPAALAGCMVRTLPSQHGILTEAQIRASVRPRDDDHAAWSKLLVLENTHNAGGGTVWPLDQFARVARTAHELGMRVHLDGARLWNACIASGHKASDYCRHVDSVSACFSKGLGAPVGSAVAGDRETIRRVFRFRKMFGGAMRQAGILAAAAIHALDHHLERLAEDHANAKRIAESLATIPGYRIDPNRVQTNLVYFDIDDRLSPTRDFAAKMKSRGVWILDVGPTTMRAVTHLDVTR